MLKRGLRGKPYRARAPSGNSEKPQNEKERKRKRTYKSDKPPRERKRRTERKISELSVVLKGDGEARWQVRVIGGDR